VFDLIAIVGGAAFVVISLADLVNTLVSTSTSYNRWWPSRWIGRGLFVSVRSVVRRLPETSRMRDAALTVFGPVLLILLLFVWCMLQVTGFALIWWGMSDIATIQGVGDAWYYSGVVFFTVGFGEIVPVEMVPRSCAIAEAFFGVITVALVIGYLLKVVGLFRAKPEAELDGIDIHEHKESAYDFTDPGSGSSGGGAFAQAGIGTSAPARPAEPKPSQPASV
jgi:hypothetical protein